MAADSAVTVSSKNVTHKIYNSANKLFALSNNHPVGVMIYNAATLTGVPFETIIKMYRRNLNNKSFNTVAEYRDDFIKFMNNGCHLFSTDEQEKCFYQRLLSNFIVLINDVRKMRDKEIENNPKKKRPPIENYINDGLNKNYQINSKLEFSLGMNKTFESKLIKKYKSLFHNFLSNEKFQID
ncbi:MAG: hypothetical protein HOH19_03715 [Kordiimonadaceae bacterium]|jgi:hypothetical protein|nr:hypothetical protein [Kordiimonadaceae bacterium]MBT6031659.1 hypothetical protein [Kordiimonadaceae bacterium]